MATKRKNNNEGGPRLKRAELQQAKMLVESLGSIQAAADHLGMPRKTLAYRYHKALESGIPEGATVTRATADEDVEEKTKITHTDNGISITYLGVKIETPEALLEDCNIDLSLWEIDRVVVSNWEVAGKIKTGQEEVENPDGKKVLKNMPEKLWKTPLRQIRVTLRKKEPERRAIEDLLLDIKAASPKAPKIKRASIAKSQQLGRKSLELCIMDPHLGLHCFPPAADHAWSIEDCRAITMWAVNELLRLAEPYGAVEEIVFPFGNDFLHHDNVFHTTTAGTPQPEGMAWQHVYKKGIDLAIEMVDAMKQVAPVKVYSVPGNHDRQTTYTLGHVLWAYYNNDPDVYVDASADSYKFHRFGTNLIGFEHGHSVKPIRMAALMANECSGPGPRQGWWDQTSYREWHVGDQHRKGSGKPSMFEEQGVSVEYLPGLTPPNEWHRLKSYNWQKRGAMAFIWDYEKGQLARLQVNLNSYTGAPTGMPKEQAEELFRS